MDTALLCGFTPERSSQVVSLLRFMKIFPRTIGDADYDRTVGELLAVGGNVPGGTCEVDREEVLILNMPERRIRDLLQRFRRHGIRRPELICMVTPTNRDWTVYELEKQLKMEREAFRNGGIAHEEKET